eukprot:CAMPEP_0198112186 /NCGR_PEP_ID=MMETSP1442-20131203/4071_1 /TAXON_ID= /ORGANISM="Craspedostauros australis, Strain CCMP3328" /LENGTH=420 /DNA_ID=CAMNT_0043768879 /DNA_START=608 /DNA_END=1870 /DNA_ORIENTATION=-
MTQPSWTPAKARMLCLAYLEIKKEPGKCKNGTWPLIFENFKRRIAQYNERMAIKRSNRGYGGRNDGNFGDDFDVVSCPASADSLRHFLDILRRSTLQLRKILPPTPHTSPEAEFEWIADWRESCDKRFRHSRLNVHALVECWRLLKDAPQIADASSPASVSAQSYPQPTLRPFRLLARKSVAASVRARNRCNHQGPSPHGETGGDDASEDGDNSVRTSGDDQHNLDDDDDDDDDDDNEYAPATVTSYDNTESSSDNDSATQMRGSNDQQATTAYAPSRKRKRRGVSADADRSTRIVFKDDEEDGNTDDSAHVENSDAAGDDNNVATTASRRQHRGRRRDNTDGTSQVRSETAQVTRTEDRNSARSTSLQCSEEMDMIREELRLAKLKRNYHDLRLQELNLKLQVAEAKKEMEEAHHNRSE